jgi:single-strand DNA-binding protein
MSYAKTFILGRLTRDVEMRQTGGGTPVGNFAVAVNKSFKTAAGEKKEEVTFYDCVAFGATAETIARFFSKGREIFVECEPRLEQWEAKDGSGKRSKMTFTVREFSFTGDKPDGAGADTAPAKATAPAPGGQNKPAPVTAAQRKTMAGMVAGKQEEYTPIDADDLPF